MLKPWHRCDQITNPRCKQVALNTFMLAGVKQLLADLERNPTFANAEVLPSICQLDYSTMLPSLQVADNLVGPLLARAAMQRLAADIAKHGVSVRTLIEQYSMPYSCICASAPTRLSIS